MQILLYLILLYKNNAQSWLECTDYNIISDNDKLYWDKNKCNGYPRGFTYQYDVEFGVDTGFNVNIDKFGGQQGRHNNGGCYLNLDTYNDNIKISKYNAGQIICLAYPSKTHVADICTNQYIPDNGVKIYRGTIINSTIFDIDKEYQHLNGEHINGQIDHKGFQNCPRFCENMDKSLCTMCFKLEDNILEGRYTFKWSWEFNPGEFYHSCWDADIINNINKLCSKKTLSTNETLCPNVTNPPTEIPTEVPIITNPPTEIPTESPCPNITNPPTEIPTESPCPNVTNPPTESPIESPTESPCPYTTTKPTTKPTIQPTTKPTEQPIEQPTELPIIPRNNINKLKKNNILLLIITIIIFELY